MFFWVAICWRPRERRRITENIVEGVELLITDKSHRVLYAPFLVDPAQELWRSVTFDLGIQYIFINYARSYEGIWISQCSVFWRQEDVLLLCRDLKADTAFKVLDIWLLLPCTVGDIGSWKWLAVKEILAGSVKHSPSAWPYYITCDGQLIRGGESGEVNNIERKEEWEQIFLKDIY
jgi:hypothetical protein